MDREKGANEAARPKGAGHAEKDQEEQDRVGDVEDDVDKVVLARIKSEHLDIEHM